MYQDFMPVSNELGDIKSLPGVIDLFSGCGGLAAGFDRSGFKIAGGADIDIHATATASYNLAYRYGRSGGHACVDLSRVTARDIPIALNPAGYIVVGGPPCQAYSRAGRGKLRSLGEHHLEDPRGTLYRDYVRLCLELGADGVVMENVPESIDYGGVNVPELVSEILENEGFAVVWSILNAADFGVPQVRERMILVALKKNRWGGFSFPEATHSNPNEGQSAWSQRKKKLSGARHFQEVVRTSSSVRKWVTTRDALSDLPSLFPDSASPYRLHQPSVVMPYSNSSQNEFQDIMRAWYSTGSAHVSGNSFRNTARDFPIFELMRPGDDFRQVVEISESRLAAACRESGISKETDPERYGVLVKKIVPPYARDKFHEKWKRLDPERPSHTLVAHLGVDTYSHIHPWEPRGISVREAARLQSFPDGYLFSCNMSEAFRQIGNAVPPLLSRAIALHLKMIILGEKRGNCS